jgi:Big-like domain-containing protein
MGFFDTTQNVNAAIGVAGFSLAWDHDPAPESFSEPTPGSTDAFYHGPAFPNQDRGVLILSQAGQGCHTANAKAWDNAGTSSGLLTYGPLCYDTIAPLTTAMLSGTSSGGVFTSSVVVKLSATDAGKLASTMYSLNGSTPLSYAAPVTISTPGRYTLSYFSKDSAGNIEAAKSKTFTIRSSTTTRLTSSLNPSTYARSVTLTATVTPAAGAPPTGTVTFKDGSSTLGTASLTGGKAIFATAGLAAGSHIITAVYVGGANDSGSTSAAFAETVNRAPTTTSVSSSLNPSSFGKSVALKATIVPVLGGPPVGGTVTFKDGSTVLGTASISGTTDTATFSTSALRAGSHSITAIYSGGPNRLGSTSPAITETVNKAATSIAVVSSPAALPQQ